MRLFSARPNGARQWFVGLGSSMAPLIRSGDRLWVERCEASDLKLGDVAMLSGPHGTALAHLVIGVEPLTTATFLGVVDREPLHPLGRVVAVRKLGVKWPLERRFTRLAHGVASFKPLRDSVRTLWGGALVFSAPLRERLLSWVRVVSVAPGLGARLSHWVAGVRGAAVIAALREADRQGQVALATLMGQTVGVAWRSGSQSDCAVAPWWRGSGLEAELLRALP